MSAGDLPGQSAAWIEPEAPPPPLRVGEPRLVRGGASVSVSSAPAAADEPLTDDSGLSEAAIAASGLFSERAIEIGAWSEEPVVARRPVVREELVVRRDVEARTERIDGTVRRTVVDVERKGADSEP